MNLDSIQVLVGRSYRKQARIYFGDMGKDEKYYVYSWFRKGFCLYVGFTRNVCRRLIQHKIINRRNKVEDHDVIFVELCKDYTEARRMEREMLLALRPLYNYQIAQMLKG